ncbi:response regulator [Limnochorda pilosa]|uniref:response regulator n=1 Tax=Limnochorda pilosa TaxID=1555112 RepID=UPI00130E2001|nr:response regulator transcription factor [Limnochorda pilosa]
MEDREREAAGRDVRVLLVEPETVCRAALLRLLSEREGIRVAAARAGEAEGPLAGPVEVDVALVALDMGGGQGLHVAQHLVAAGVPVAALTRQQGRAHLVHALSQGIRGYLPRAATPEELVLALQVVAGGGTYIHPSANWPPRQGGHETDLTEREAAFLVLLERGAGTPELARAFFLSEKTVRNALSALFAKLGARSRLEAVAAARARRLL